MVKDEHLQGTPMYEALKELASEMDARQMPPATLNVIGGFALMLWGYRDTKDITDIDYVGIGLYEELNQLSGAIGLKHGMEPGWINNDGMLVGDSMESFELSTGKLHFEKALTVGQITINVVDEKDLLRLKVISADTAMTELEATGEYARTKDFADIQALMGGLGMSPDDVASEFEEYLLCKDETIRLVTSIYEDGPEAAASRLLAAQEPRKAGSPKAERTPYMEQFIDELFTKFRAVQLSDTDLDSVGKEQTWEN